MSYSLGYIYYQLSGEFSLLSTVCVLFGFLLYLRLVTPAQNFLSLPVT